ncbi:mucin-like protein [Argopecten irradians]|uniref:mucin-like protein n=1 Tax=Argopecten irradians TaxID=31199 RepID=UPI003714CE7F
MNHYFDTCPRDNGWFVVVDTHNSGRCTWEQNRHNPHFLYSEGTQAKDSKDYSVAEVFAIWVLEADIFSWSPYGHCSRSCDTGMMIRMRTCHIPDLAGALSPCSHYTHVSETTNCNNKSCPSMSLPI